MQKAAEGASMGKGEWAETEKIGDGAEEASNTLGQLILVVS